MRVVWSLFTGPCFRHTIKGILHPARPFCRPSNDVAAYDTCPLSSFLGVGLGSLN